MKILSIARSRITRESATTALKEWFVLAEMEDATRPPLGMREEETVAIVFVTGDPFTTDLNVQKAGLGVIAVATDDSLLTALNVFLSDARGFLTPADSVRELARAVNHMLGRGMYISDRANQIFLRLINSPIWSLSDHHKRMLPFIAARRPRSDIAHHFGISEKTVTHRFGEIRSILGLKDGEDIGLAVERMSISAQ